MPNPSKSVLIKFIAYLEFQPDILFQSRLWNFPTFVDIFDKRKMAQLKKNKNHAKGVWTILNTLFREKYCRIFIWRKLKMLKILKEQNFER